MSDKAEEVAVSIRLAGDNIRVGTLWVQSRHQRTRATFEYSPAWLQHVECFALGPALGLVEGQTHDQFDGPAFGPLGDSAPDRWGRMLMQRAEARRASDENRQIRTLHGVDYLLGVNDTARMGALRFSRADRPDEYLAGEAQAPIPPLVQLPELLSAAERISENSEGEQDIRLLLAPGSSLGGVRPKASVMDMDGSLSIAKFPRASDQGDVIRWEAVALQLAEQAGIRVPRRRLIISAGKPVLLLGRFDRASGQRIPFLSALSMLGGSDHTQEGSSYLEMASALSQHGAAPKEDLQELWRRIVFTVMVNNTDDHLRNHGFLYDRHGSGWRLSPAYDINPTIGPRELSTAISDNDARADLDLARSVASEFRLSQEQAEQIIDEVATAVRSWSTVARTLSLSKHECTRMAPAFAASTGR